jgi:predicted  nucleic acid-binding Zn-ribbon protein
MPMDPREALWTLHLLDVAIAERQAAADALAVDTGTAARLAELRDRLESLRARARQVRSAQQAAELQLQSLKEKRQRLEQELYSGRLHPRELVNLQRELDALARQHAELESWVLEQMEEAEAVDRELEDLDGQLQSLEAEYRALTEERAARSRALQAELESLRQRRQAQAACMDPQLVEHYERLRGRLQPPVAKLVGAACGGCHVSLAPIFREQLAAAGVPLACPACGRLLVP